MKTNKQLNFNRKLNTEFEDDNQVGSQAQLGYFINTKTFHQYTVPLDEDFVEPQYYRSVVSMLDNAEEGDTVVFNISSRGGALSGLQVLLEAVKSTQAHTVSVLVGQCASAASIFAMYTDTVIVTDSADMLVHYVSFQTGGKGADIVSHVAHVSKTSEKLIRNTYKDFLSESEIDAVIEGKEMYFDADEIRERLANREEARELEYSEDDNCYECNQCENQECSVELPPEPTPVKPKKTKATT